MIRKLIKDLLIKRQVISMQDTEIKPAESLGCLTQRRPLKYVMKVLIRRDGSNSEPNTSYTVRDVLGSSSFFRDTLQASSESHSQAKLIPLSDIKRRTHHGLREVRFFSQRGFPRSWLMAIPHLKFNSLFKNRYLPIIKMNVREGVLFHVWCVRSSFNIKKKKDQ